MKKTKKILGMVAISMMLVFGAVSCNMNTGDGTNTGNNKPQKNHTNQIKFNFSDAKALASQEQTSGRYIVSARATKAAEDLLVKILDDGSLESAIVLPESWGNASNLSISQIAISPAEKSNEIYVVINNGSGWNGCVGGLLCVSPDGTYVDILTDLRDSLGSDTWFDLYGNSSNNDYIKFDKLGNMYFQTRSWASSQTTSMIYKYNPARDETTQLTPAVSGTYYEDYIVSDNGAWIFASAYRWSNNNSTRYLRAIPTANADQYVNITYSSSGNGYYRNLIYDDENGYLYFNGWANNNSGIYRVQKKDGTFSSDNLKCMTTNNNSGSSSSTFWFWSMVESKYTNVNLGNLLEWENSSEEVIEPQLKKVIYSNNSYTIVDNNDKFLSSILIEALIEQLKSNTNYSKYTTEVKALNEYEEDEIPIYFSFKVFAEIPEYKLLAEVTDGLKNEKAFEKICESTKAMQLLYKLLENTYWERKDRYSQDNTVNAYNHNFLADITYLQSDDKLLSENKVNEYFKMLDTGYEKFYQYSGCLQFICPKSRSWVSKMKWHSNYMSGDEPNYKAVLSKFFDFCDDGDKIFTLAAFKDDPEYGELYTDKLDEEALKYITESDKVYLLRDWLYNGNDEKKTEFLKKTCLFKDSKKSACSIVAGSHYKWKDEFYDEDGNVKASDILSKFYGSCVDGEKEFNLKYFETKVDFKGLYTDKIDEEAIEFISSSDKLQLINNYINSFYSNDDGHKNLIKNTCFLKGTNETAYKETSSNSGNTWTTWSYGDLKAMSKTSKGIFGSVPGYIYGNGNESKYFNKFMKLFDEKGIFEMKAVPESDKYFATEIQVLGDLMVFKNSVLNSNGDETGSHTIQAFDASTSSFTDLFKKVDGANIEIISYSVGGGYVYFSGVQGLTLVSGKINMETLEYTPIYSTKKMNQIITVTQ